MTRQVKGDFTGQTAKIKKVADNTDVVEFMATGTKFSKSLIPPTAANGQTAPAIPIMIPITVPAGASGDVDTTIDEKMVVTDIVVHKTAANGGSGDTVTIKNGSNAISNAIDLNINQHVVARAGTINNTYRTIAAGGTLRCSRAQATNGACEVFVYGFRSA